MIYLEHQGKAVLAAAGIPVPEGRLFEGGEAATPQGAGPWFLKVQRQEGGRGRRGLVRRADSEGAVAEVDAALREAAPGEPRLLEAAVPAKAERFLAIGLDTGLQCAQLVVGSAGGVAVEDSAPETRVTMVIPMARGVRSYDGVALARRVGLDSAEAAAIGRIATALWRVFREREAELVEINPLIWDGTGYVAADAKLVTYEDETVAGTLYYERDGCIALLSGGAGLGMALADMLTHLGTPPANFADIVGGVTADRMSSLTELVLARTRDERVKAVLMLFTVSHTPIERVLEPVVEVLEREPLRVPAVAYVHGGIPGAGSDDVMLARLERMGIVNRYSLEQALRDVSALAMTAA